MKEIKLFDEFNFCDGQNGVSRHVTLFLLQVIQPAAGAEIFEIPPNFPPPSISKILKEGGGKLAELPVIG